MDATAVVERAGFDLAGDPREFTMQVWLTGDHLMERAHAPAESLRLAYVDWGRPLTIEPPTQVEPLPTSDQAGA